MRNKSYNEKGVGHRGDIQSEEAKHISAASKRYIAKNVINRVRDHIQLAKGYGQLERIENRPIPKNYSIFDILDAYIAALRLMDKPCPTTIEDVERIGVYKNFGYALFGDESSIPTDIIEKKYIDNHGIIRINPDSKGITNRNNKKNNADTTTVDYSVHQEVENDDDNAINNSGSIDWESEDIDEDEDYTVYDDDDDEDYTVDNYDDEEDYTVYDDDDEDHTVNDDDDENYDDSDNINNIDGEKDFDFTVYGDDGISGLSGLEGQNDFVQATEDDLLSDDEYNETDIEFKKSKSFTPEQWSENKYILSQHNIDSIDFKYAYNEDEDGNKTYYIGAPMNVGLLTDLMQNINLNGTSDQDIFDFKPRGQVYIWADSIADLTDKIAGLHGASLDTRFMSYKPDETVIILEANREITRLTRDVEIAQAETKDNKYYNTKLEYEKNYLENVFKDTKDCQTFINKTNAVINEGLYDGDNLLLTELP